MTNTRYNRATYMLYYILLLSTESNKTKTIVFHLQVSKNYAPELSKTNAFLPGTCFKTRMIVITCTQVLPVSKTREKHTAWVVN